MSLPRRISLTVGFFFFLLAGMVAPPVASAEECALDLQSRSSVSIDGAIGSSEWGTAGRITSSDNCLDHMSELGPDTGDQYPITVHTRRYTDGATEYLGFAFDVDDQTPDDAQERVFIYFDGDLSGNGQLDGGSVGSQSTDQRLMLSHEWEAQSAGSDALVSTLEWGTPNTSNCWTSGTASVPSGVSAAVTRQSGPLGYEVEIRVPVDAIGSPTSDIGIGLAVVDDHGSASSGPVSLKYAASFPADPLKSTNLDNPNEPCADSYTTPDNFGVGLWSSTRGAVTISRNPVFWNSEDIEARQCGEMTTYRYHPARPCQLTLDATVHNDRPVDLDRHILYLWADHGASPSNWRFIDLQERTIGANGNLTISSDVWQQVPAGLAHHPCVRAYILPENLDQGGWDEDQVRNVSSNADISAMMSAYGLSTMNWAQKNISATAPTDECPVDGCAADGSVTPLGGWPFGGGGPFALLFLAGGLALFGLATRLWLRSRADDEARRAVFRFAGLILLAVVFACEPTDVVDDGDGPDGPRDGEDGIPVLMSEGEFERFHEDHAIVQLQVYGIVPIETPSDPENIFYDVMGGVHRLLPIELVVEEGRTGIPVELQVSNPESDPRRLYLRTRTVLPPELQEDGLELVFERGEQRVREEGPVVEPGQSVTLRGRVVLRPADE